jgi:hypothetical protein
MTRSAPRALDCNTCLLALRVIGSILWLGYLLRSSLTL